MSSIDNIFIFFFCFWNHVQIFNSFSEKKMKNYTIPNKFPLKEELLNEATKQKQAVNII
jgi:hypothetical protein